MKHFGIVFFLVICLILTACGGGSSNSSDTLTGNWTATLTNTDQTPAFVFTTSLTQSNGSTVTGTISRLQSPLVALLLLRRRLGRSL